MENELPVLSPSWAPAACTLPAAERPLRSASFDQLFADVVLSTGRTGPRQLRLDLQPGRETAARAAELAAAETECCSFFTFTLTASGGALTLDVSVPDAHIAVLDALAQRIAAAAGDSGLLAQSSALRSREAIR